MELAQVVKCVEFFRNLYSRVATSFGVDRSLVCRVAHGQRRSTVIERKLIAEFERLRKHVCPASDGSNLSQDNAA